MDQKITDRVASLEIKTTADGSPTLFVPELNEHYHSVHGALQESKHVFIEAGLRPLLHQNLPCVKVLEVGFGTGLNAILTYAEARKTQTAIAYHTLEAYPLPGNIINELHITRLLEDPSLHTIFGQLHQTNWEENHTLSPYFDFRKVHTTLQEANLPAAAYHVVYFDAFAPEKQPELWEEDMFGKIFASLQNGGALVTYCAKGIVKRRLKAIGFTVETIPGPPGKREMIRALKNNI